ncbi:hypothetical protein C8R44DRAFT_558603, partial [Mycena epipterygia]
EVPPLMVLDVNHPQIIFSPVLAFDCAGTLVRMYLRGVIYGGQGHFTCRFFEKNGTAWFHDGASCRAK